MQNIWADLAASNQAAIKANGITLHEEPSTTYIWNPATQHTTLTIRFSTALRSPGNTSAPKRITHIERT